MSVSEHLRDINTLVHAAKAQDLTKKLEGEIAAFTRNTLRRYVGLLLGDVVTANCIPNTWVTAETATFAAAITAKLGICSQIAEISKKVRKDPSITKAAALLPDFPARIRAACIKAGELLDSQQEILDILHVYVQNSLRGHSVKPNETRSEQVAFTAITNPYYRCVHCQAVGKHLSKECLHNPSPPHPSSLPALHPYANKVNRTVPPVVAPAKESSATVSPKQNRVPTTHEPEIAARESRGNRSSKPETAAWKNKDATARLLNSLAEQRDSSHSSQRREQPKTQHSTTGNRNRPTKDPGHKHYRVIQEANPKRTQGIIVTCYENHNNHVVCDWCGYKGRSNKHPLTCPTSKMAPQARTFPQGTGNRKDARRSQTQKPKGKGKPRGVPARPKSKGKKTAPAQNPIPKPQPKGKENTTQPKVWRAKEKASDAPLSASVCVNQKGTCPPKSLKKVHVISDSEMEVEVESSPLVDKRKGKRKKPSPTATLHSEEIRDVDMVSSVIIDNATIRSYGEAVGCSSGTSVPKN